MTTMRRIIRMTVGVVLILLGIPGLVLPILQGWLFLAMGALFLSVDFPFFDRAVLWICERVPQIRKPILRLQNFLKGSGEQQGNK